MSKASMKSLIPRYNAQRMLMDYITHFYGPANRQRRVMSEREGTPARELAKWKKHVAQAWSNVSARRIESAPHQIAAGDSLPMEVAVKLNGIAAHEVAVECLVGMPSESDDFVTHSSHLFHHTGAVHGDETFFRLDLKPSLSGLLYYKIRLYPTHPLLSHRFETGRMLWI
jgi:starch phosphorylase